MSDGNKYSLSPFDWKKIAKGAGIAAAGGVLGWMSTTFIPQLEDTSNAIAIAIAGVLGIAVNALQKFLSNTQQAEGTVVDAVEDKEKS